MEMKVSKKISFSGLIVTMLLSGCASMQAEKDAIEAQQQELAERAQILDDRDAELSNKAADLEAQMEELEAQLSAQSNKTDSSMMMASASNQMLPPFAKPGECYTRVWAEPQYKTASSRVKVKDAYEKVDIIPPTYETVTERVLVAAASTRKIPIPAVYDTETTRVQVSDAIRTWRTSLKRNAPPASASLLKAAGDSGINLDDATPKSCFYEYYRPEKYETVTERVLVSEGDERVEIIPARYETVEKRVLVAEASSQITEVPAVYETITERVLDKPAHTIWKKGTGPIQRIDETTGEIMCLVEVPATYKTITKRMLKNPATVKEIEIPAKYEVVKVREQVAPPDRRVIKGEPVYKSVTKKQLVRDPEFVWLQSRSMKESGSKPTGNQICLHEVPAQYSTVKKQIVKSPASFRTEEIPAKYKTVKVRKVVTPAQERRVTVPAEFKTVQSRDLLTEGRMEWRSILCETNMTGTRISSIQRALQERGYNPGKIDGVIGASTMQAVNAFQRAEGLPVDKYLNIKTLQALGVSPR